MGDRNNNLENDFAECLPFSRGLTTAMLEILIDEQYLPKRCGYFYKVNKKQLFPIIFKNKCQIEYTCDLIISILTDRRISMLGTKHHTFSSYTLCLNEIPVW